MTTRLDLIADRHRLRMNTQQGHTWHFPWEQLPEAEREKWRGNVRAVIADLHHASHDTTRAGSATETTEENR